MPGTNANAKATAKGKGPFSRHTIACQKYQKYLKGKPAIPCSPAPPPRLLGLLIILHSPLLGPLAVCSEDMGIARQLRAVTGRSRSCGGSERGHGVYAILLPRPGVGLTRAWRPAPPAATKRSLAIAVPERRSRS